MAIILIRTIIVFLSITISLRLMGKRQIGELELSELVVAILISNLAANPLEDIGVPLLNGLVPIAVLLCCEIIISGIIMKSLTFRSVMCGRPSILVENGVICQSEMRKNRFTIDELTEELRNQGIIEIQKIKYAVLETDGVLNTILYPDEQPVTPKQLGIKVEDTGYSTIIINDGTVVKSNLERLKLDEIWLKSQLETQGYSSEKEIFVMIINDAKDVYILPMEEER